MYSCKLQCNLLIPEVADTDIVLLMMGWDCHPKHVECNEVKNKSLISCILLDY